MHHNLLSIRIGHQLCQNIFGRCPDAHRNGVALLVAGVMALLAATRSAVNHIQHHTAVLIPTGSSGRPAPTRLIPIIIPVAALARLTLTNPIRPDAAACIRRIVNESDADTVAVAAGETKY
ncbi:hypothetical protein LMH87_003249 [Akanthomyces muscarius]|uniref:Uncharacterized protein n=1 Tax=Akanthomyces muscarius TaxID=2231603 RepID=A0A9W8Q1P4_AKAMU|nr:hypothetical protein LMH87_003249 [Akanthomyces muscarius]KAJ4144363.1 hypothetical protein LMH87_003249 [Akanthomyces muscarius]